MRRILTRWLAIALAIVLSLGVLSPVTVLAESAEATSVDYTGFLADLKVLEGYAAAYAAANNGADDKELVINYIRTGVSKYTTGTWTTMAGAENTGFTAYVAQQDGLNGTTATALRNLVEFTLPNGQQADFEHMFGAMNIAYVNSNSADLGSWAGDLCDLLVFAKNSGVTGDVETMAENIRKNYLGLDLEDVSGFGVLDIYGDLDAFYLMAQIRAGGQLSAVIESYYTAALTDADRAAYFMNKRFSGLETREDVRAAIYDTYRKDVAIKVLEADEGVTAADANLRQACCYAFADYLFDLAGDRLEGGSGEGGGEEEPDSFYTIFSQKNSTLAPGISQSINYAITQEDKQIAFYTITADLTREDVGIHANYSSHDPSKGWNMARVPDQMASAQAVHSDPNSEKYIHNFNVIAGINADFYNMSTGQPTGALVLDGVEYQNAKNRPFFAILKDGTPVIGSGSEWANYAGNVQEAIGGSEVIIRDGALCVNPVAGKMPRCGVGITADGKIVLIVLDGRQEPFSAGATMAEFSQIMLDAGCVIALNLDGGGSATMASKAEGSDSVTVVSSPSDGYVRSVSSSLVLFSTAETSTEFSHALITAPYSYLTVGTSLELTATGVSLSGNAAQVPEDAVWQVSDSAIGSVEDGVFTALENGDVEVQLVLDGEVVGSLPLHVVVPDALAFEKDTISVIYGVPTVLPLNASYQGNAVAFNEYDVFVGSDPENVGVFEGLTFTGDELSGIRNALCAAFLMSNDEVFALTYLNLYKDGEAVFDFENATAGNRTLAWNREVSNATTEDKYLYQVVDHTQPMDLSYTFALDMEQIEIPERLKELTYMLPGADQAGASAWTFLLQLAERVSTLTEVKVTAQFDTDLDVDISELKIVNEYFYLKSAEIDETNTLTVIAGWYDQTMAIEPTTANPVCILSGIKATPKEGASWNEDILSLVNTGTVSYKIYLRANALYSFAQDPANQAEYSLYPFINPNDATEKGASFGTEYADFEDRFVLNKAVRQGWMEIDGKLYYFVDNEPLTGLQKLPGYEDGANDYVYSFDDSGICTGFATGLLELDGALYYAINGEVKTGWRSIFNAAGESVYYYFDPVSGKALDGKQTIDGRDYTFTNYILTEGQIVPAGSSYRYYWAGTHVIGKWITVGGKTYYATFPKGYFAIGMVYARTPQEDGSYRYVFDETGALREDLNGMFDYEGKTYLAENGRVLEEPGLVMIDGYYYYFNSSGAAVKGRNYWITKTNNLLPQGQYYFDESGKMTNPPAVDPQPPVVDPQPPVTEPEAPKDGIVEENGKLYYYKNGVLKYGVGLIFLDGYYYYVRSNAQLAIGKYWVTNTNGLMDQGMHNFGPDGKMTDPPAEEKPTEPTEPSTQPSEEPSTQPSEPSTQPSEPTQPPVKNGIVEENGALYYYLNGTRDYGAGLIYLDGYYYYVRSNAQLAIGQYWVTNHNGLLPQGMYTFGPDGKMIDPPAEEKPTEPTEPSTQPTEPTEPSTQPTEPPTQPTEPPTEPAPVKNGVVEENGVLYYYVNGTRGYGLGLILVDGDYYYVRSNAQLAIGQYWVTNNNGLLPQGMYTFGADGKMIR